MGFIHGSILRLMSPGRNPISSSTLDAGLVTTTLSISPFCSRSMARSVASMVLPVPAGPSATTILVLIAHLIRPNTSADPVSCGGSGRVSFFGKIVHKVYGVGLLFLTSVFSRHC
jgi:hypothetical protein